MIPTLENAKGRPMLRGMRDETGSGTVEGLAVIYLLSLFIGLFFVFGAYFWNQVHLTSTAQQIALLTQTQVSAKCGLQATTGTSCEQAKADLRSQARTLLEDRRSVLIGVTDLRFTRAPAGYAVAAGPDGRGPLIVEPGSTQLLSSGQRILPRGFQGRPLSSGWGYSFVEISATQPGLAQIFKSTYNADGWDGSTAVSAINFAYFRAGGFG